MNILLITQKYTQKFERNIKNTYLCFSFNQ